MFKGRVDPWIRWAAAVVVIFLVALTVPTDAQAQGNCAGCTNCFTCSGGLQFGVENCDMASGDPECPCQNLGSACNPQIALGPQFQSEVFVADGGKSAYLLGLGESVFGHFDCSTGELRAVFQSTGKGAFRALPSEVLAAYQQRFHLSSYLDAVDHVGEANSARVGYSARFASP